MKNRMYSTLLLVLLGLSSGCTPESATTEAEAPLLELRDMQVTGMAGYRERIALTPGSTFEVSLLEVSRADAPANVIATASRELGDEQVPLPFTLEFKEHMVKLNLRYSVRATITDAEGRLAWTTDTAHAIDPSLMSQDLGMLQLVRVAR